MEHELKATSSELRELQNYFESERKRFDKIARVAAALAKIGNLQDSEADAQRKLEKVNQEIAAAESALSAAVAQIEASQEDAAKVIREAESRARQIVDTAGVKASHTEQEIEARITAKRQELAELQQRVDQVARMLQGK